MEEIIERRKFLRWRKSTRFSMEDEDEEVSQLLYHVGRRKAEWRAECVRPVRKRLSLLSEGSFSVRGGNQNDLSRVVGGPGLMGLHSPR